MSIALATPLGFLVGVARLSPNYLLSRLALVYVELMRNTPLLLQLLFWYNAVLKALPGPRQSMSFHGLVLLNNRGLYPAAARLRRRSGGVGARAGAGVAAAIGYRRLGAPPPGADRPRPAPVAPVGDAGDPRAADRRLFPARVVPIVLQLRQLHGFNLRAACSFIPSSWRWCSGFRPTPPASSRRSCGRASPGGLARAERGGLGPGPVARTGDETGRRAAGAATDHSAADQPIAQHRQELLAGGVHRLSRSRTDLRRHGAQPDPGGDAGDGDHDGRLSRDFARHFAGAQRSSTRATR